MILQITVVADLIRSEDAPTLIPEYAVENCHPLRLPRVHSRHKKLWGQENSRVHSMAQRGTPVTKSKSGPRSLSSVQLLHLGQAVPRRPRWPRHPTRVYGMAMAQVRTGPHRTGEPTGPSAQAQQQAKRLPESNYTRRPGPVSKLYATK